MTSATKINGFSSIEALLNWCLPIEMKIKFDVTNISGEEAAQFLNSIQHEN